MVAGRNHSESQRPPYTPDFFKLLAPESLRAAEVMVPMAVRLVQPSSVIDIGCGTGDWLAIFARCGAEDVFGVDGHWVPTDQLHIPSERFMGFDLTRTLHLDRNFDLAISLEVAEHLPATSAADFVSSLVRLAPIVMFSAAIPGQGGTAHINEQWPSYWAARFARYRFVPVNCFRAEVWNDSRVEPYYAQNVLLFAREDEFERNIRLRTAWERGRMLPLDVVHPRIYEQTIQKLSLENAGPRKLLPALSRATIRAVKRRLASD